MASLTAPKDLVNALLAAISIKDPEKTLGALNDRGVIWREKRVYMDTIEKKIKQQNCLRGEEIWDRMFIEVFVHINFDYLS